MRNFLDMYYENEVYPRIRELEDCPEYHEARAEYRACYEALRQKLAHEEVQTLNRLVDALVVSWDIAARQNFFVGFRLGLTAPWS